MSESKCFLFLTEYKNDSLVQHPGSLVFEESWYSHLCIILPIPTYPHPVSLSGCKGCSLFDCGANARTDSTLILILVWWILRNIISHSSLAVSRFWEEVNVSPILSQGGPGLCLCELQQLEADRKQQNCWVQWLQELGSIGGIEKPVKFREIGNSVTCLNLKNHRIREW